MWGSTMMTDTTAFEIRADEIEWDRPSPCGDCPFLKTSPYHQGVAGSLTAYVESIRGNRFAHTCHKTDNRPACDGPKNHAGKPQHCVGAILMLLKTGNGMDLQLPLLQAAEAGKVDLAARMAQAKAAKNVFTVKELLRFYRTEVAKRLEQRIALSITESP
jgi:hypothetical protein